MNSELEARLRSEIADSRKPGDADEHLHATLQLKDRLVKMFLRIPALQAAGTIPAKLSHAAAALTGREFFHACSIFLEDSEAGLIIVTAGESMYAADSNGDRYAGLRGRLDAAVETEFVHSVEHSETAYAAVLVPMRGHDGRIVGLTELEHDADSLCTVELLTLVEVFLLETAQSIEQFRLERELEASEATYRSLIDNVGDVIFRVNTSGKLTFVSRQVKDLLGLEWKAALGMPLLDWISPEHVERGQQALDAVLSGQAVALDVKIRTASGRDEVVFISANPVTEHGAIVGGLGVARNVTEKQRLEEQIRESERRYRALTENAYDAIFLVDPVTFAIVDVNPQAERLTGYARAELLNMSVMDLRRPQLADEVRRRIESVMVSGGGRFEDTPLICRDGREVPVDAAASVYEIEGKRYYQAIVRDISVQKQMNSTLNQRLMELRILAEVSDALQSAVDLQSVMSIVLTGVTAGKGLGFNRAFLFDYDKLNHELHGEAGLGPPSAEEAGRIWAELETKSLSLSEIFEEKLHSFPEDSSETFYLARQFVIPLDHDENVFARAVRNREALRVERAAAAAHLPQDFLNRYPADVFAIVPLVTRDDVMGVLLVDNLFTLHPIGDEDLNRLRLFANSAASAIERSRLLVSLERRLHELTITNKDLKVSRDRLIKTERLSAIGEVAASVAHEIRNPLTAIGGFARSVYSSLDDADKNRRKIEIILEETDRLEHMLSALLEFTRPAVPRFTDMDVNALIMQTVHFMATEIDPTVVEVAYELNPELPMVWADSQQIRQVLMNIIRNALQELPHGGRITVLTEPVGEMVQIAVQDTGQGIAPENLDKIFEAFYTTKPSGSGLGLPICAQIIRNHNGRIEALSRLGNGATFIISLPKAQKIS